ncbi:MAG: ESX secretion-associated protein EspG [Pseudonocardiaceae bacterium]
MDGYPVPIQVGPPGHAGVERGRLRADAGDELRWLALVRAGRVDADLEAALRLLNWPASWLDSVWFPTRRPSSRFGWSRPGAARWESARYSTRTGLAQRLWTSSPRRDRLRRW